MSTPERARVERAQAGLDAAVVEMLAATSAEDLADARRAGDAEAEQDAVGRAQAVPTHWVVAVSLSRWVDGDQASLVTLLLRDDSMSDWVISGLLRRGMIVADHGG